MLWIIMGIGVFIVFLWSIKETPEDIKAAEKYRHEIIREEINFTKSEMERRKREINKKRPPLWP